MQNKTETNPSAPKITKLYHIPILLWALVCLVGGYLLGISAAEVQKFRAPLLLFPLGMGAVTGLVLGIGLTLLRMPHKSVVWGGCIISSLLLYGVLHYQTYQTAIDMRQDAIDSSMNELQGKSLSQGLSMAGLISDKPTFWKYVQNTTVSGRLITAETKIFGVWVWVSWIVEALLVIAASLFIAMKFVNRPFCCECNHWYEKIRSANLTSEQTHVLAESLSEPLEELPSAVQYHSCVGGCNQQKIELQQIQADKNIKEYTFWKPNSQREQILEAIPKS